MNHVHRICRSLASLTRLAGLDRDRWDLIPSDG
jgi:hypothetical protein